MSYPVLLGAVVITTSNNRIVINEGGGDLNADIPAGTYYLRGDGASGDLCKAIADALDAAGSGPYSVGVTLPETDPTALSAKIVILLGSTFSIFKTGTTFDEGLLGFSGAQTGDVSFTSTKSPSALWVSPDPHRELEPFMSKVASVKRSLSGRVKGLERSRRFRSWRLGLGFVRDVRMLEIRNSSDPTATLESFMDDYGAGASMELHDVDVVGGATYLDNFDSTTLVDTVHFSQETIERFEPRRIAPGTPLYAIDLVLHSRVTP